VIVVCEPQCKSFSHEKVNSGFLYGVHLAFPNEKIKLYAHPSHIDVIKQVLRNDGVTIPDIEYVAVEFGNPLSLLETFTFYFLLKKIFSETISAGVEKIFFLSFSAKILYLIKKIKKQPRFANMKFASVLHGEFEVIAATDTTSKVISLPVAAVGSRIRQTRLSEIPYKAVRRLIQLTGNFVQDKSTALSQKLFPVKKMLLWRQSDHFRYIALSPHIIPNARKFIDVDRLNIYTVVLPTFFAPPLPQPDNVGPKFAVFGYGNSSMLHQVLIRLAEKKIKLPYEIRIIGIDSRGASGFENVTVPVQGRGLSRAEMELYAKDIDAFLILYEKNKYEVSCSGSILEALSYMKPVLHFDNVCINTFNREKCPIGIRSESVEAYVEVMADIISNYDVYRTKLKGFRDNILISRDEFSIANSKSAIRESFTWA
jgi:hypothetical protein